MGICLPSNVTLSVDKNSVLKLLITSFLGLGACVVGFFYVQIFKSAFQVNKKKVERLELKNKYFDTIKNYNTIMNNNDTERQIVNNINLNTIASVESTKEDIKLTNIVKIESINSISKITRLNSIEFNPETPDLNKYKCESNNEMSDSKIKLQQNKNNKTNDYDEQIYQIKNFKKISSHSRSTLKAKKRSITLIRSNLRMATMIFFVTKVYYLSIIPWILTINNVIKFNPFIYYTFTLNCSLNPLIYFFFYE